MSLQNVKVALASLFVVGLVARGVLAAQDASQDQISDKTATSPITPPFAKAGSQVQSGQHEQSSHPKAVSVKVLRTSGGVDSLAWGSDGTTLAVLTKLRKDGKVKTAIEIWDTAASRLKRTLFEANEPTFSVSLAPDGQTLACVIWRFHELRDGSYKSEIVLLSTATGKEIARLAPAPTDDLGVPFDLGLLSCAFSPDGRTLAAVGKLASAGVPGGLHIGGEVCAWDLGTRQLKWHNRTTHTDIVYEVAFSPDGRILASAGRDKLVRLWDPAEGRLTRTLFGAGWDGLSSLAFSPDGSVIASAGRGFEEANRVRMWDVRSGELTRILKAPCHILAFRSHSEELVTLGGIKGPTPSWRAELWDRRTGKSKGVLAEKPGSARAITISHRGDSVAVGTFEGEVFVVRLDR